MAGDAGGVGDGSGVGGGEGNGDADGDPDGDPDGVGDGDADDADADGVGDDDVLVATVGCVVGTEVAPGWATPVGIGDDAGGDAAEVTGDGVGGGAAAAPRPAAALVLAPPAVLPVRATVPDVVPDATR